MRQLARCDSLHFYSALNSFLIGSPFYRASPDIGFARPPGCPQGSPAAEPSRQKGFRPLIRLLPPGLERAIRSVCREVGLTADHECLSWGEARSGPPHKAPINLMKVLTGGARARRVPWTGLGERRLE